MGQGSGFRVDSNTWLKSLKEVEIMNTMGHKVKKIATSRKPCQINSFLVSVFIIYFLLQIFILHIKECHINEHSDYSVSCSFTGLEEGKCILVNDVNQVRRTLVRTTIGEHVYRYQNVLQTEYYCNSKYVNSSGRGHRQNDFFQFHKNVCSQNNIVHFESFAHNNTL